MAEIRYLTDENVSRAVIYSLRQRGVDVLSVPDAGLRGDSDQEILFFAWKQGRVLYTQDDDFLRLHADGQEHCGIVYAHQRIPTGEIIQKLMLIFQIITAEEMVGEVEYL